MPTVKTMVLPEPTKYLFGSRKEPLLDKQKLQEIFADEEYVKSIAQMSAEDAAKSLNEKGVDVTADDLMKVRDFVVKHKDELQNGELSEEALAEISGGSALEIIGLVGEVLVKSAIAAVVACILLNW